MARSPVGPLARWPVGPLAHWPLGPLAFGLWPLWHWALGFGLGLWGLRLGVGLSALAAGLQPWPPLLFSSLLFSSLLFSSLLFSSLLLPSLLFLFPHEKLLTTKNVDHIQVNPGVWWATWCAGCHAKAAMHVGCPFGESAHVDRLGFFGTWWFEDTTPMSIADVVLVALCMYAGGA